MASRFTLRDCPTGVPLLAALLSVSPLPPEVASLTRQQQRRKLIEMFVAFFVEHADREPVVLAMRAVMDAAGYFRRARELTSEQGARLFEERARAALEKCEEGRRSSVAMPRSSDENRAS